MSNMKIRSFTELQKFSTFIDRYNYLKLLGEVGKETFGFDRYLNQKFYTSRRWLQTRDKVILRDNGCNLGIQGYEILGPILIHHMNPVSIEDFKNQEESIFDPEFLICTTHNTHLAIHFGDESLLPRMPVPRFKNDTTLWK